MSSLSEREKVAHLLRRFGLGASESELDSYAAGGYEAAVDRLLTYESVDEHFPLKIEDLKGGKNDRVSIQGVVLWWTARLLTTRRPLQEKMTVFWHNHFATSAGKVQAPLLMWEQNETLRRNATGSFRTLLSEVSKDPAMLQWLDNGQNVKGHANENYAREVMELFTLGIGHYTESDVLEAARAFTGWSYRRQPNPDMGGPEAEFVDRPKLHDAATKTIFGKTGNYSGDDVLGMLTDQPQCAQFLVHKLWEWFVYPSPPKGAVEHFAQGFYRSGYDIKALLRAIMLSREFTSARAVRAVVKCPVDFVIPPLRQLGVGEALASAISAGDSADMRRRLGVASAAVQAMKQMGMYLLFPPDVSGWKLGRSWISTATMVARMQWGQQIIRGALPVRSLFAADASPESIVSTLVSVFDAPMPKDKLPILVDAARKAGTAPGKAASTVTELIFSSPEYQLC